MMSKFARETGRKALITMIKTELRKPHPDIHMLSRLGEQFLPFATTSGERDFAEDLYAVGPASRIMTTNELINETVQWAKKEVSRLF